VKHVLKSFKRFGVSQGSREAPKLLSKRVLDVSRTSSSEYTRRATYMPSPPSLPTGVVAAAVFIAMLLGSGGEALFAIGRPQRGDDVTKVSALPHLAALVKPLVANFACLSEIHGGCLRAPWSTRVRRLEFVQVSHKFGARVRPNAAPPICTCSENAVRVGPAQVGTSFGASCQCPKYVGTCRVSAARVWILRYRKGDSPCCSPQSVGDTSTRFVLDLC
jgi:hypothetical protein